VQDRSILTHVGEKYQLNIENYQILNKTQKIYAMKAQMALARILLISKYINDPDSGKIKC